MFFSVFLAEWYPVRGGMQDYNYWKHGCLEVTLEISCCKYPSPSQLETIWNQNKKSLIDFLKYANRGVRGIVKFADGTIGQNLTIKIDNREPAFKTNGNGEYYRILIPGQYTLTVLISCTNIWTTTISVPSSGLLEYNITLDNSFLSEYRKAKLDRVAVFCTKSISRDETALLTGDGSSAAVSHMPKWSNSVVLYLLVGFSSALIYANL